VEELSQGYILSLVGTIKDTVVPLADIVEWAFQYLQKHYWEQLTKKFLFTNKISFHEFIDWICQTKKFLLTDNRSDIERAIVYVFNEIKNGKGLRINYEK
jgi:ribosome biogenesis GTPase A